MACFYMIWLLVPDPIADERINFGVTVFDDYRIRSQFVSDWSRVEMFAGESVDYAKYNAENVIKANMRGLLIPTDKPRLMPIKKNAIEISGKLHNSIQLSRPRGSIGSLEDVLKSTVKQFLKS